jgi:ubiquinone/menaquinone biosynthesis C-methylase UbiE
MEPSRQENSEERDRIRAEYERRRSLSVEDNRYSFFNPAYQFEIYQRQKATTALLRKHDIRSLADKKILEVGCGRGDIMFEYLTFRTPAACLYGLDLLPERVSYAHERFPTANILNGEAENLPYKDSAFDFVMQYTVFSSILSDSMKSQIASEMLRVLNKSHGMIIWYDFWINPSNRQTRGVTPSEIRQLFPGCTFDFRKITLAPPLARRSVKISWILSEVLEKLTALNSHYLVAIKPYRPHP